MPLAVEHSGEQAGPMGRKVTSCLRSPRDLSFTERWRSLAGKLGLTPGHCQGFACKTLYAVRSNRRLRVLTRAGS